MIARARTPRRDGGCRRPRSAEPFVSTSDEEESCRAESGTSTVEWVLLVIVALLVLTAVYYFLSRTKSQLGQAASQMQAPQ